MTNQTNGLQQASTKDLMQVINQIKPQELVKHPALEQKFVQLFQQVHRVNASVAEGIFHAEKFHFLKQINESAALRECEGMSLYGAFMDVAVNQMSFDPSKKLAYLIPGSVNIGTRDNPQWIKRASLVISPQGELAKRQMDGQIKYADNPVIVYAGDEFEPHVGEDGIKKVHYKLNIGHTKEIIAAFIRIVRTDGSTDFHWLLKEDVERLKGYSERRNNGKANALYNSSNGQIDPGFLAAKMIKHAFKSYPKVKVRGAFTKMETEVLDDEPIDYAIELKHEATAAKSDAANAAVIAATSPDPSENGTVQFHNDNEEVF